MSFSILRLEDCHFENHKSHFIFQDRKTICFQGRHSLICLGGLIEIFIHLYSSICTYVRNRPLLLFLRRILEIDGFDLWSINFNSFPQQRSTHRELENLVFTHQFTFPLKNLNFVSHLYLEYVYLSKEEHACILIPLNSPDLTFTSCNRQTHAKEWAWAWHRSKPDQKHRAEERKELYRSTVGLLL